MFTSHGHRIPGTTDDGTVPQHVTQCGGPTVCNLCYAEVAAGFAKPIKKGLPDPELEKLLEEEEEIEKLLRKSDHTSVGYEEIRERFGYHRPGLTSAAMHKATRKLFVDGALVLDKLLPQGPAKAVAMMKLEEACMWANKAIAEMSPVVDE